MVLLVPRAATMTIAAGSTGLGTVAAWTGLSAHDTASHALGEVHRLFLAHVCRIIDE